MHAAIVADLAAPAVAASADGPDKPGEQRDWHLSLSNAGKGVLCCSRQEIQVYLIHQCEQARVLRSTECMTTSW